MTDRGRVAVIGDIGGHADALRAELARLGADPATGRLPPDLTVVQVGDLVHRGPDSEAVVALVDGYLTRQPDRWVQLVGNHEAQYLREPTFAWRERIDDAAAATLRRWWAEGRMRVAAAVVATDEEVLVTHAGLTAAVWRDDLGAPAGAGATAAALDALAGVRDDVLFRHGRMLAGTRPVWRAGPVWAHARAELVASWLDVTLPFSQVHGHSSVFDGAPRGVRERRVTALTTVDPDTRHETSALDGGRIVGVDPGHGARPREPWRAWETRGAVVGRPGG